MPHLPLLLPCSEENMYKLCEALSQTSPSQLNNFYACFISNPCKQVR